MSRVPHLRGLHVDCAAATLRVSWEWAHPSTPQVRVLRSVRCCCGSPDDHVAGDSGQTLVHEGVEAGFADDAASEDEDLFYTVFARRGSRGPWRRPVWVRVRKAGYRPPDLGLPLSGDGAAAAARYAGGSLAGERFVEVEGDAEAAPAVEGPRDLLTLAIPVATMVMLGGFLVGVDARIITAGALALAIAWRLADGAEPDLRRFRTYLAIAAAAALFVFLATALIYFFAGALGATEGIGIYAWQLLARLYPVLLVVAMAGIWVFGGRLSGDSVGRRWWWALAVGLVALGALIPVAACVLAIVIGGLDYRAVAKRLGAGDQRARGRAQGSARGEQAQRVSERQALPSIAIRPGQKLPFCWAFACRLCPVGWRRCSSFGCRRC